MNVLYTQGMSLELCISLYDCRIYPVSLKHLHKKRGDGLISVTFSCNLKSTLKLSFATLLLLEELEDFKNIYGVGYSILN